MTLESMIPLILYPSCLQNQYYVDGGTNLSASSGCTLAPVYQLLCGDPEEIVPQVGALKEHLQEHSPLSNACIGRYEAFHGYDVFFRTLL